MSIAWQARRVKSLDICRTFVSYKMHYESILVKRSATRKGLWHRRATGFSAPVSESVGFYIRNLTASTTDLLVCTTTTLPQARQDIHKIQSATGAVMIRLLIVEDQPGVRQGLRMLLDAESDLSVIGEAADGEAALALAASLRPDVVLMDVEMRRMDGIATTTALHRLFPRTPIIMLSIHDDAAHAARADGAGAATFVSKLMPAAGTCGGDPAGCSPAGERVHRAVPAL